VDLTLPQYGATGRYQITLNNQNTHRLDEPFQIRALMHENMPDENDGDM
jgi:hypothetical protein